MNPEQEKLLDSYLRNLKRLVRCQRLLADQQIDVGLTLGSDWNAVTVQSDGPEADAVEIMNRVKKELDG